MGDYERTIAAYLFLLALEGTGYELTTMNIHLGWLEYCRDNQIAGNELLAAAISQGFQR